MTNPFALDAPAAPATTPALPVNSATAAAAAVDPQYAAWLASQQAGQVPSPVGTAPATAQPAGQAAADPFDAPAPQRPKGPRLQEMYGRLILIMPKSVERRPSMDPKRAGELIDRMTADVVILDGGPIHYGGKPEDRPPVPHDKVTNPPHRNVAMFISAVGLISQCRVALEKKQRGEPGMVLGRLTTGEKKQTDYSAPWLLAPFTPEDAVICRAYLATVDPFA